MSLGLCRRRPWCRRLAWDPWDPGVSAGSLGGGCSAWLVCWKDQHKDELAARGAGSSPLSQILPRLFLSLKLLPHPWGGLGSCHLPALPQGHVWGDASSLLGWRMGTGAGPSLLGWSRREGAVRVPGGAHILRAGASPSARCSRGLGWVVIIVEEKYLHQVPCHVVSAHPPPGEGRCLPRARMLWWAVALHPPQDPPTKPGGSPRTRRHRSRQLLATSALQPVNLAAWPQGSRSN